MALAYGARYMNAEIGFHERDLARVYRVDRALANVDAYDLNTVRCQNGRRWKTDIAKSDNSYAINGVQDAPHIDFF
ncbi:hypothetical protein Pure05_19550 [Paenarthrobacter ureafaciens]|nr:hypothetical protein Pure01_20680 [Paenarthrobacter ureafaciens]GLU63710.1 hypothetical protein Pure02_19600 [Paenarthrobacter ureafaciens]GLU68097.1 hypothetical protein Pure03_20730 [Paenarthrobacter ureafaciens]GLU72246.1 hypothetical protein Pure04_19610 [Paenarthrobacter ureafaciens]GLU76515.1 hypothetical protein Pure05_19550 [Paenarthrobacter ureafaciens]